MADDHSNPIVTHWSAEAGRYTERHHGWRRFLHLELNQRKRLALKFIHEYLPRPTSLLDVGCGTGAILRDLSPHVPNLFGIDPSREMIAIASREAPGAALSVGYLDTFPNQVQVVTSLGVVGLIDDLDEFFSHVNRVLVDGGHVLFSFIHRDSFFSYCEIAYNQLKKLVYPGGVQSQFRRYSATQMTRTLRRAGFVVVRRSTFGFYSNAFKVGPLKYLYAPIEALLDIILPWEWMRYPVGINHLVLARKVGVPGSAGEEPAAGS